MPPSEPGDNTPLDDDYPLAPDPLRMLADWRLEDLLRVRVLLGEMLDHMEGSAL